MRTINIHQAKTHLSRLLDEVQRGEPFVIAKAGKPIAKVVSVDNTDSPYAQRLGFLSGHFTVPEDFNEIGQASILRDFGINDDTSA